MIMPRAHRTTSLAAARTHTLTPQQLGLPRVVDAVIVLVPKRGLMGEISFYLRQGTLFILFWLFSLINPRDNAISYLCSWICRPLKKYLPVRSHKR